MPAERIVPDSNIPNIEYEVIRRGPPKGVPIEIVGRMWAREATEEIRAGTSNAILISRRTKKYNRVRKLPTLTGEKSPGWNSVWYDKIGNMYMSRWPLKKIKEEEGKRYIYNPKGFEYEFLNRKRVNNDFFENPPKTVPVRELILDTIDSDIGTAIRKVGHVVDRTKTEEMILARRVVEYTDNLANKFITERMTSWGLENLAEQTIEFLEEIELLDPEDPDKKKMKNYLIDATTEDRTGAYFSPMIARVRVRAAYLAAMRRVGVQGLAVRKFAAIEQILINEESLTRWAMEAGTNQLIQILGHADFSKPDGSATKKQRAAIANIFFDTSENHFAIPRVKPYLAPALYTVANLIGIPDRDRERLERVLGVELTENLIKRKPIRKLVIEGKFSEVKERVEELCIVISWELYKHEQIEEKES